jgi:hypothetical protein
MHQQQIRDNTDALEVRVTRALERMPAVTIPAEFAARVAGRLPQRRTFAARPARYGLMAMRISMAVLVIAVVAVAMHASGRNSVLGIGLEWVLCAELVTLAVWLSGVRGLFVHEA